MEGTEGEGGTEGGMAGGPWPGGRRVRGTHMLPERVVALGCVCEVDEDLRGASGATCTKS